MKHFEWTDEMCSMQDALRALNVVLLELDGLEETALDKAVFGNIPSKDFGWSGDARGNIEICYYGESIHTMAYDDESIYATQNGEYSDLYQIVEVTLESILQNITASPVNDGSSTVEFFKQYSNKSEA